MDSAILRVERVSTSLKQSTVYGLSPTDAVLGRHPYITRPLFLRERLDWETLQNALRRIERVYPPLCGRYFADDNGSRGICVDPNRENGFGTIEIQTEHTIAGLRCSEGMLSGVAIDHSFMNWPYFLQLDSDDPMLRDRDSLFGVHLIHAADGCVLNFSIRHLLCDGTRFVELIVDVGRAYRGLDIDEKHLSRGLQWPDQYLSHFSSPKHSADMYPRRFIAPSAKRPVGDLDFHVAQLYLPRETISEMKNKTRDRVQGVEFVSTNDLVTALCWMVRAEMSASEHPVTPSSLPVRGTSAGIPADTRTTCVPVVPHNYFGNAVVGLSVTDDAESGAVSSHIDTLGRLASLVRREVRRVQTEPEAVLEGMLAHYSAACSGQTSPLSNFISATASQSKMAFREIDFGQPGHLYMSVNVLSRSAMSVTETGPNGEGLLVSLVTTEREREVLESSTVLADCVPRAVLFPRAMEEHEAMKLLGL